MDFDNSTETITPDNAIAVTFDSDLTVQGVFANNDIQTVTPTGASLGGAAAIVSAVTIVNSAIGANGLGLALPTNPAIGAVYRVINPSAYSVLIYPGTTAAGNKFDAGTADNAVTITAGKVTEYVWMGTGTRIWYTTQKDIIAGTNVTVTSTPGNITIDSAGGGGGGGAPTTAAYVVLGSDASLTNERTLIGTANQVAITDNGANNNVVLSLPPNVQVSDSIAVLNGGGSGILNYNGASGGTVTLETAGKYATLRQSGGYFGATSMTLQNEYGMNGVLFKQEGIPQLVDFGMTSSGSPYVNIFRMEYRTDQQVTSTPSNYGEFQMIIDSQSMSAKAFAVNANEVCSRVYFNATGSVSLGGSSGSQIFLKSQVSTNGSVGAAGQVLTSQGANLPPTWTTVSGGDGAPTNATYLTLTPNSTLTNELVFSTGNGLVMNTSSSSVKARMASTIINNVYSLENHFTKSTFDVIYSGRYDNFTIASATSSRLVFNLTGSKEIETESEFVLSQTALTVYGTSPSLGYIDGCIYGYDPFGFGNTYSSVLLPSTGTAITIGTATYTSGLPVNQDWGGITSGPTTSYDFANTYIVILPKNSTTSLYGGFVQFGTSFSTATFPSLGGDVFRAVGDGSRWFGFTKTSGVCARSTSGTGSAWSTISVPTNIMDVVGITGAVVAALANGDVTYTKNSGLSWSTVSGVFGPTYTGSAGTQTLQKVSMCEFNGIIYMVLMYDGVFNWSYAILRSDNGGESWLQENSYLADSYTLINLPGFNSTASTRFKAAYNDNTKSLAIIYDQGIIVHRTENLVSYGVVKNLINSKNRNLARLEGSYFYKSADFKLGIDDIEQPLMATPWEVDNSGTTEVNNILIVTRYSAGSTQSYAMYNSPMNDPDVYSSAVEITVAGTKGGGIIGCAYKHGTSKIAAFLDLSNGGNTTVLYTADGLVSARATLNSANYGVLYFDPVHNYFYALDIAGVNGMYSADCVTWTPFTTGIPATGSAVNYNAFKYASGYFAGDFYTCFYHSDINVTHLYVRKSVAGAPSATFYTIELPAAAMVGSITSISISNQGLLGTYGGLYVFTSRNMKTVEEFNADDFSQVYYDGDTIGKHTLVINDMPVIYSKGAHRTYVTTPDLGKTWISIRDLNRGANYAADILSSPNSPKRTGYIQVVTDQFPFSINELNFNPIRAAIKQERVILLDFGTVPVQSKTFTFSAVAGVTLGTEFVFTPLPDQGLADRNNDELEMDTFFGYGRCTTGATFTNAPIITVTIHAYPGPVKGKYAFLYTPK
jgi:hypothetical protein